MGVSAPRSTSLPRRSRALSAALLVALAPAAALAGCAAAPEPPRTAEQTPAGAPAVAPAATPPVPTPAGPPRVEPFSPPPKDATIEPADGKWLVDEEGREYFTTELPRREGAWAWEGEDQKQVRAPFGLVFDVVSHDAEKFVVKVYRPVERQPTPARPKPDTEAIEAAYAFDTPTVDRLAFAPFEEGLPQRGQWRQSFDLADIDGDGHLDIVHGPARKTGSRPAIFLGDGRGRWRAWTAARFPQLPLDYGDAAVGDLDGDGHSDLVIASHLRGITALRGDGQGNFTEWSKGLPFVGKSGEEAAPFSSREVELADWNGDGRLDILALGEGPGMMFAPGGKDPSVQNDSRGLMVFLNQGDGSWVPQPAPPTALYGDDLAVADLDGDGRLDFVTGSAVQGSKSILNLGRADGSYETRVVPTLRDNATVRGVAVADFDGDGRLDLAIGYLSREGDVWRTGVDVLLADGEGGWRLRALHHERSMEGIYALAAGDLDGDGATDLVAFTRNGYGWAFLGDGRGGFARATAPDLAQPGCTGYHVELADLDGDGRAEVVAGFAGEGGDFFGGEYCPSAGSLRAWKPVPGGASPASAAGPASPAPPGPDQPGGG